MKQDEVQANLGKTVVVAPYRDIGIDPNIRRIIGKDSVLVKQCKSGLLQIEHDGKLYSLPMSNVNPKSEEEGMT